MRLVALPVMALLILPVVAACTPKEPAPVEPAAPKAMLANIELDAPLVVSGVEPFWSLEVANKSFSYKSIDDEAAVTGPTDDPVITGNIAVWRSRLSNGTASVLTLTGTDCSDGMSDLVYPLAARLELGERTLVGCATSKAALEAKGPRESGRVE